MTLLSGDYYKEKKKDNGKAPLGKSPERELKEILK